MNIPTPDFSTPDLRLKSPGLRNLGLKSSWLKSLGLKGPALKFGVENSGVEMFFNPLQLLRIHAKFVGRLQLICGISCTYFTFFSGHSKEFRNSQQHWNGNSCDAVWISTPKLIRINVKFEFKCYQKVRISQ